MIKGNNRYITAAVSLCLFMTSIPAYAVEYKAIDIPGADQPAVIKIRNDFLKPSGVKKLMDILDNAESYRLYVHKKLTAKNMPSSLEYLPVVESDYNPSAKSKDGNGVGMWQFMPNSTDPFLVRNEWVDERLDPWRSTDAALSKLSDNYHVFNDWLLAVAAYNCGAGAMVRALKNVPEKTFWYLAENNLLPDHTIRYVPKLLAIADIVQNSAYYGIELPAAVRDEENPLTAHCGEFDYITVKVMISLTQLAGELRIDEMMLEKLNPALLRGVTPPDGSYSIRLPSGMQTTAEHALTQIKTYKTLNVHTIIKGNTLWSLSRTYGITVEDICTVNAISPKTTLEIGKILYIPVKSSDN